MIRPCAVSEILDSTELIAEYAAECSIPAIGEINPHRELYDLMEKSGMMRCFMAYDGEKIGFAILLMPVLPHYSKRVANLESLFIAKAHRKGKAGRELMRAVEAAAKEAGCAGILYSAPTGGKLERLLDASKPYQRTNAVFYRSL
jgi:GNAT superfamily N-acetyltransferase